MANPSVRGGVAILQEETLSNGNIAPVTARPTLHPLDRESSKERTG